MKFYINYITTLCLVLVSANLFAQLDGECNNVPHPLYGVMDNLEDPCCGTVYQTLCYDMDVVDNANFFGPISQNGPYKLWQFLWADINLGFGNTVYSYEEIAEKMNEIAIENQITVTFTYNNSENTICADGANFEFGDIVLCSGDCSIGFSGSSDNFINIPPVYTDLPCPLSNPSENLVNALANPPDVSQVDDLTLFDGALGEISTQDLIGDIDESGYATVIDDEGNEMQVGPDGATIGLLLNAASEGGLFDYGGCFDFNCIDLGMLADGFLSQNFLNNIDAAMEAYPEVADNLAANGIEPGSQEYIDAIQNFSNELSDTSFPFLLNQQLGMSLPTGSASSGSDCPEELTNFNFDDYDLQTPFGGGTGESESKVIKDKLKSMMNVSLPKTEAGVDMFNSSIPGLGANGAGGAAPSPSSQEDIKRINGGVSLYNGSQSSQIPLHTLQSNDISIPIGLSSLNNGLKVNDLGTLVGHNWSLNAAPSISRIVKGLPDEFLGTMKSVGAGKTYHLAARLEAPSEVTLNIGPGEFNGFECDVCELQTWEGNIVSGFSRGKQFGTAYAILEWSPLRFNLITLRVGIPVGTIFGLTVYVEVGFSAGVVINEKFGEYDADLDKYTYLNYENEGIGYLHMSNSAITNQFNDLPPVTTGFDSYGADNKDKANLLRNIHSSRKRDDGGFLNSKVGSWNKFVEALENLNLFNDDPYVHKGVQMDTEPDEFSFNCGGYAGTFMFKQDGDVIVFPHQDVVVTPQYADKTISSHNENVTHNVLSGFNIRTPDGKEYQFGGTPEQTFEGVDITETTSYYLPNMYTFPETPFNEIPGGGEKREYFEKAQVSVSSMKYTPVFFFSPNLVQHYADTYNNQYKINFGVPYTSKWNVTSIKSNMTQQVVNFEYENFNLDDGLKFYSNKSYSYNFPNFDIQNGKLKSKKNPGLSPLHLKPKKWENGKAEFAYNAVETRMIDRWRLIEIDGNRGEKVRFYYNSDSEIENLRGSIVGDELCDKIKVLRGAFDDTFKGWKLNYQDVSLPEVISSCDFTDTDSFANPIEVDTETSFNLGRVYNPKLFDYNNYLFLRLKVFCVILPFRIPFPLTDFLPLKGFRTHLKEFSSLMEVKSYHGLYDKALEDRIFNAEGKRMFLSSIEALDKNSQVYPFVDDIDYAGELDRLPKRFSINQDEFGYFVSNSKYGSPFPRIKYTSIEGQSIDAEGSPTDSPIENLFGFFNQDNEVLNGMRYGQTVGPTDLAKTGALARIIMATGAELSFRYELNPRAGIRVGSMTENPMEEDAGVKTTNYKYSTPTVVNEPIRIFQDARNFYTRTKDDEILEERVTMTSGFQNTVFPNKNNFIGYRYVTESWEGIGSTLHSFTSPENIDGINLISDIEHSTYYHYEENKKRTLVNYNNPDAFDLTNEYGYTFGFSSNIIPPALQYYDDHALNNQFIGVETATLVRDDADNVIQEVRHRFEEYERGDRDTLRYFRTQMYQFNDHGTVAHNYIYGNIPQFAAFLAATPQLMLSLNSGTISDQNPYEIDESDYLGYVWFLVDLSLGTIINHPFKEINRYYTINDRKFVSTNIRLVETKVTNKHEGAENQVTTTYLYNEDYDNSTPNNNGFFFRDGIPTFVTSEYSDGNVVTSQNIFWGDGNVEGLDGEFEGFDDQLNNDTPLFNYLLNIRYGLPLFSKKYFASAQEILTDLELNPGNPTIFPFESNVTGLGLYNNIVVARNNWSLQDGDFNLVGIFDNHNSDGKPTVYKLAKFGASLDGGTEDYFPDIILDWNDRLQLKSRTYEGFAVSYDYDDTYFILNSTTNEDNIVTSFGYDNRWRLTSKSTNNGHQKTDYKYSVKAEEGENSIITTLSFPMSPELPSQGSTTYTDGFGKTMRIIRNDGTLMQTAKYDDFFRAIETSQLGKGQRIIAHESSPISRTTAVTDPLDNTVITTTSPAVAPYFEKTEVVEPAIQGDITTSSYIDALGRSKERVSGMNGATLYDYDELSRLTSITSPIVETYNYDYNEAGLLWEKVVPGGGGITRMWYDECYRLIASLDANGSLTVNKHDNIGRVTHVYLHENANALNNTGAIITDQTVIDVLYDETLLIQENVYATNHTWMESSQEKVLGMNGDDTWKRTTLEIDNIGRVNTSVITYPEGFYLDLNHQVNDAGLIPEATTKYYFNYNETEPATPDHTAIAITEFDDLLRPEINIFDVDGFSQEVSRLVYNSQDQVEKLLIGKTNEGYLQQVDYKYDGIGRLYQINSPAGTECLSESEFCQLDLSVTLNSTQCGQLSYIQIGGEVVEVTPTVDIINNLEIAISTIENALNTQGYIGDVLGGITNNGSTQIVSFTIQNTDAQEVILGFAIPCDVSYAFNIGDCCTPAENEGVSNDPLELYSLNDDLYHQRMSYDNFDIGSINIISDCQMGRLQFDYMYDADHRIEMMTSQTYGSSSALDVYNTAYSYDLAGNIKSITRNGFLGMDGDDINFGQIDVLRYNYGDIDNLDDDSSILRTISDDADVSIAHNGFKPGTNLDVFEYKYDGVGNVTKDPNKMVDIAYHPIINLPSSISSFGEAEGSIDYDYTVSMEKLRKEGGDIGEEEERWYIAGMEILKEGEDFVPQFIGHSSGRVIFEESEEDSWKFQYHINDHLGNSVVLFEEELDDEFEETGLAIAIQRNLYYPFGMTLDGTWNMATNPEMNYLYNGKELENDLDLDWNFYGFRIYDPSIGRFSGVDPIAEKFSHLSPFNYAGCSPLSNIDLFGLQPLYSLDGSITAYRVQEGQGPSQIAKDLNENYGSHFSSSITWDDIVSDNLNTYISNGNYSNMNDINDSGYRNLNINTGDILDICAGTTCSPISPKTNSNGSDIPFWRKVEVLWDGPYRRLTPDMMGAGIEVAAGAVGVGGAGFEFVWILHGPEKHWLPNIVGTGRLGVGYEVDINFSSSTSFYTGPVSDINTGMFDTPLDDILLSGKYVNGGASIFGLKVDGTVTVTPQANDETIITTAKGIGAGIPGPQGSTGISGSKLLASPIKTDE